jgi:hypothetical protein
MVCNLITEQAAEVFKRGFLLLYTTKALHTNEPLGSW